MKIRHLESGKCILLLEAGLLWINVKITIMLKIVTGG
jgi:hypothetical protein